MIGIKTADQSFYPILDEDFRGKKRLVVTTVRDNQSQVQIDFFKGEGKFVADAGYIGSLIIENIQPAPKGEPEIEVFIGIDDDGTLNTTAHDVVTGEKQTLSVSLKSFAEEKIDTVPDFEIGESLEDEILNDVLPDENNFKGGISEAAAEESSLTGETYPIGAEDRRKEHLEKSHKNPVFLLLFIIIGFLIIAAAAYFIYRSLEGGPAVPPLVAGKVESSAVKSSTGGKIEAGKAAPGVSGEVKSSKLQKTAEKKTGAKSSSTAKPAETSVSANNVWYVIKRGDTLWDISSTYYRNPWLYPKIARANSIKNPDLIFAGTKIVIPSN